MFGKILSSVSSIIRSDLKRNLNSNAVYKKNRWNVLERLQVYCSTYYIRAMLLLWLSAASAVLLALCLRPLLHSFASQHLRGVSLLAGWMSNLLGSQLTIIGIVFPLVVGLISVLFQKKSSRIHIQSAYQLHSGYMFSGLSGLSLAGFILIAGLASSLADKYLDTAFAVTAFLWMFFNIMQSIWFFIISLNVLDDKKRDKLMLKYFQAQILTKFIQESKINFWIRYLGPHIAEKINDIKILPYHLAIERNMELTKFSMSKEQEVRDVYIRPLLYLLRKLKASENNDGEIVLLPLFGNKNNEITILASSGVNLTKFWVFLFKKCFRRGDINFSSKHKYITRDFYGEVYDSLEDKNINAFGSASDRLVNTYTSLKKCFKYDNGNYIDECNTIDYYVPFSQSFHFNFSELCRETIKTIDTSGEYYRRIMDIPSSIYHLSDSTELSDFRQCIESLFRVWCSLTGWKAGHSENLSVSQEQRHRELISIYIGKWESWNMWLHLDHSAGGNRDNYASRLLHHLYYTPQIIMAAVTADDRFATDHSTDMLMLWFNQTRFEQNWEASYLWHSYFLTPSHLNIPADSPDWLTALKGNPYAEKSALSIIFSNALSDIRLLVSGYILSNIKQHKNVPLNEVINRLLKSELVYPTGAFDRMTDEFKDATDIIDSIIRIESRTGDSENSWYNMLSDLVKTLSSQNERQMITGRIYMGTHEDIRNMYDSYADVGVMLSSKSYPVSKRVNEALTDKLFSYNAKTQIIYLLNKLKRDLTTPWTGDIIPQEEYIGKAEWFNSTLETYISAFTHSQQLDIISARIDTERIRNTDLRLTTELLKLLSGDDLLSHFSFHASGNHDVHREMRSIRTGIPKEMLSRDINHNFFGELTSVSDVRSNMLNGCHYLLNQLPIAHHIEANSIKALFDNIGPQCVADESYILIVYGERLIDELRELTWQKDRHKAFGVTLDAPDLNTGTRRLRVNNCIIYQAWGYRGNYSLLIKASTFGDLSVFSYPDKTLFNTYWCVDEEDPLIGSVTTLWEHKMEVTGTVIARFEHL